VEDGSGQYSGSEIAVYTKGRNPIPNTICSV
jgi:hypothetical protein